MENFLEDIFLEIRHVSKQRVYLKKQILEFKKYPFDDLFIYICHEYTTRETIKILLNLPELWFDTDIIFWQNLMLKNLPRMQDRRASYFDNSKYDDIKFLISYIGINPLDWYFSNDNIPINDKINMLLHCKKFISFILPFKGHNINKFGYINKDKKTYQRYCLAFKAKMLENGGFKEGFTDINDFMDYLDGKYTEMLNYIHNPEDMELLKEYESILVVRLIKTIKLK